MKLFLQVFSAVLLATGISLGSFAWFINGQVADFKLTMTNSVTSINNTINKSVITIADSIGDFSLFGSKKPTTKKK